MKRMKILGMKRSGGRKTSERETKERICEKYEFKTRWKTAEGTELS